MIDKTIHYCWFGGNPKTALVKKCIASWKKWCPEYRIVEWNESNCDFSDCPYAQAAYQQKKWAFVTDYMRFKIIYEQGGIYMDTDVELIRNIDKLLDSDCFFGFEQPKGINPGLMFGAEKNHPFLQTMCEVYRGLEFHYDGRQMETVVTLTTRELCKLGLRDDNTYQKVEGIVCYPSSYFSPKDHRTGKLTITENTCAIHHYSASWQSPARRLRGMVRRQLRAITGR